MFYAPNITSGLFEPIIIWYDTSMYRHLFPFNFLEQPDNVRIWKKIVNPVINSAWMIFWYSLKRIYHSPERLLSTIYHSNYHQF